MAPAAQMMSRMLAVGLISVLAQWAVKADGVNGGQDVKGEGAAAPGLAVLAMAGVNRQWPIIVQGVADGVAATFSAECHSKVLPYDILGAA